MCNVYLLNVFAPTSRTRASNHVQAKSNTDDDDIDSGGVAVPTTPTGRASEGAPTGRTSTSPSGSPAMHADASGSATGDVGGGHGMRVGGESRTEESSGAGNGGRAAEANVRDSSNAALERTGEDPAWFEEIGGELEMSESSVRTFLPTLRWSCNQLTERRRCARRMWCGAGRTPALAPHACVTLGTHL